MIDFIIKKNLLQLNNYSSFEGVKLEHKKSDFVYFGRIENQKGVMLLLISGMRIIYPKPFT